MTLMVTADERRLKVTTKVARQETTMFLVPCILKDECTANVGRDNDGRDA